MTTQPAGIIPEFLLPDRLRRAREVTGMTQGEFANHIGVARQTISNAERGAKDPSRLVMRAWALGTGVPLQWLETGTAPDGPGPGEGAPRPGLEPGTLCAPGRVIPLRRDLVAA